MSPRTWYLVALLSCYSAAVLALEPKSPAPAPARAAPPSPCALEAHHCMAIVGQDAARVATIGLDSGTVCMGPALDVKRWDLNASLGWIGDRLYACRRDGAVLEIGIADGKIRLAPGTCEAVTSMDSELLVQPARTHTMNEVRAFLERYASFGDLLASRSRGRRLATGITSIVAARGGAGYFARGTAHEIYVQRFQPYAYLETIPLERFDDSIHGLDVTSDGTLVIATSAPGPRHGDELRLFDAATGAARRTVSLAAQPGLSIAGLKCN